MRLGFDGPAEPTRSATDGRQVPHKLTARPFERESTARISARRIRPALEQECSPHFEFQLLSRLPCTPAIL